MLQSPIGAVGHSFLSEWNLAYPGTEPMGWKLRDGAMPWVRFHGLPNSKRYAESASERATILSRANALGADLLGVGKRCWVVEARADDIVRQAEFIGSYEEEPDGPIWKYYVREECWIAGKFDSEIAEIADDGPFYLVWISREHGGIFAPYDGGFDLFPASEERAIHLRTVYGEWLSEREDGL